MDDGVGRTKGLVQASEASLDMVVVKTLKSRKVYYFCFITNSDGSVSGIFQRKVPLSKQTVVDLFRKDINVKVEKDDLHGRKVTFRHVRNSAHLDQLLYRVVKDY